MGVDSLRTDPLARLEMTTLSIESAARAFAGLQLPWVALGGGGYDKVNVARGWTLVWGVMRGLAVPDLFPPGFSRLLADLGLAGDRLRDRPHQAQADDFLRAQQQFDENLAYLGTEVLPVHGLKGHKRS
jgi:acetoin utilization protein AcuC